MPPKNKLFHETACFKDYRKYFTKRSLIYGSAVCIPPNGISFFK